LHSDVSEQRGLLTLRAKQASNLWRRDATVLVLRTEEPSPFVFQYINSGQVCKAGFVYFARVPVQDASENGHKRNEMI
jgi:hypothetical protein